MHIYLNVFFYINTWPLGRCSLWNLLDIAGSFSTLKLQCNAIQKLLLTNPNTDTFQLQFYTGPVQVPKAKPREHQSNYTLNSKEDFPPIITIWHTISGASLDLGNPLLARDLPGHRACPTISLIKRYITDTLYIWRYSFLTCFLTVIL